MVGADGVTDERCGTTLTRSSAELDAAFGGMLVRLVGTDGITDGRCGVTLARSSVELDVAFGGMLVRLVGTDGATDGRCGATLARSSLELDGGAFGRMLGRFTDAAAATEGRFGATLSRISLELDDTFGAVLVGSGVTDAFSWVVSARGLTEPRGPEVDLGAESPGRSSPGRDSVAPSGAPVRAFVGATEGRVTAGATEGRFGAAAAFSVGVAPGTLGWAAVLAFGATLALVLSDFTAFETAAAGGSANQSESKSSVFGPALFSDDFGD